MSLTPNIFILMKDFIASHLLGSVALFVLFIIAILGILILAARVSFKIGLLLIFPAILALMGIGISQGLLGINYRWIAVLVIVAIAVGGYALIWSRIGE